MQLYCHQNGNYSGVCLTNDTSLKAGDLLFEYRIQQISSCNRKTQMLHISRGYFSKNSQRGQRQQPSIHIAATYYPPVSVIVSMTDIVLSKNMGSGLCITNVMSPVLLQSVFITGNLNGGVVIRHSKVAFSGRTILTHNRGKSFHITKSNVTFTGSLYFERNKADLTCTCEVVAGSKVIFAEHTSFFDNYAGFGSGNLCIRSGSNVKFREGRTEFIKNQGEFSGAIYAHSSYLNLNGNVTISQNVGYCGGGIR